MTKKVIILYADSTDKKTLFEFAGQTAVGLFPRLQSGQDLQTFAPLKKLAEA